MSTFRTEVFNMCKKLQALDKSHEISALIREMSVSTENKETGEIKNPKHGDFAYAAKHNNNQFHGYLYVDENIETLNKHVPISVEHLLKEEREILEIGHRTLARFIHLCLSDFRAKSTTIAECMNPYAIFKEVSFIDSGESLLTDEDMQPAVDAFKKGKVCQALLNSNLTTLFKNVPSDQMIALINITGKEVEKSYDDITNSDIDKLSLQNLNGYSSIQDVMLSVSFTARLARLGASDTDKYFASLIRCNLLSIASISM